MSAIWGLMGLRGQPVTLSELDPMGAAMAAYGSDGASSWYSGHTGMGHRLQGVTPEDRWERQPLRSQDRLRIVVSDARLDNRIELADALAIGANRSDVPDSMFVLRAYEKWGTDCAAHLVGAFAFALWDAREGHLVIARSPMAERPLYYHATPDFFAFATAPKGLFALPGVPRELDEQFLADYLARERAEPGTSFFRGVRRLLPGHTMVITRDRSTSRAHWRFDAQRELRLPRDEDYVEAFDDLFGRVVHDHLRSERSVGIMLSGGYDSSSVAVTAAPLLARTNRRLTTFTEVPRAGFDGAVIDGRYRDETPLVRALAKGHDNLDLNFINTTGRFFLDDLDPMFDAADVPYRNASNRVWHEALLADAQRQGVGVMLSGIQGNLTISWPGSGLLPQLCRSGHWRNAFREARAMTGRPAATAAIRTLLGQGVLPLLPTPLFLAIARARHPDNAIGVSAHPWRATSPVNPEFAASHRVDERAGATPDFRLRLRPDTRQARYQTIARGGDVLDGVFAGYQARYNVESRDPTGDVRIVEFCLSLPESQFQREGERRCMVRRAMANRLPAEVIGNQKRGLQAADWFERMTGAHETIENELSRLEESPLARRAIDLSRLRLLVQRMPQADPGALRTITEYRGALEFGLITGRYIRWFEAAGQPEQATR